MEQVYDIISKKIFELIIIGLILSAGTYLYADYDYVSAGFIGLSVHPGNQKDLAQYYPRRLDSNADFIFTPGVSFAYDKSLKFDNVSHLRFAAGYLNDCAAVPAGYVAAGGLLDIMHRRYFSLQLCLGISGYMRENWEHKIGDHYTSILKKSGSVEWIIMPFPEIEIRFHPADNEVQLVVDVMSVIYVSIVNVGIRAPL